MRVVFYRIMMFLSNKLGHWVFALFAWLVSTGFFFLFPLRVANSIRFYRSLFPGRKWIYHLWCAWRQFHNFAQVFLDGFSSREYGYHDVFSQGWHHLAAALEKKKGGILLMSHMGSWDAAAHLLKHRQADIRLLLYMGIKHKEQIERIQKENLTQSGIRIIAVGPDGGSPFDIVEGIRFLESGGVVSLTGDMVWQDAQRTVAVDFLGHEVCLPEIPYVLALLSGAPLFIFFAFRTAERGFRFTLSKPIFIRKAPREERAAVIRKAAQQYAHILEQTARDHPFQWYHFKPFWRRDLKDR